MNNKPKTKLLTIGLLCCGRAETTERCLKSLMPIREAIDSEIQVVDTGCSPETRAIVEKYADEVFEFEWCNDFAKARNFQLDQANGKMFLFIDDDEWFLDTTNIIKFFKEEDCLTYNIGGYFQRNYLDFEAIEYQDVGVVRMCAVTPETVFIGKVHEYIEPAFGNAMFLDARAGHFGYIYKNAEDNRRHSMRNIPLLKDMMVEQPNNLRWPFQLAQEYRAIEEYEELLSICQEGYKKSFEIDESDSIRYRATFVVGMAIAMTDLKKWDELLELYNKQMSSDEIMEIPKAKLTLYAALIMFMKEMNDECVKASNYYLKIYEKHKDDEGMVFLQGGIFINDVFDDNYVESIYSYLMSCGLRNNDYGPLVHYYRRLSWNSPVLRLNRGFLVEILSKSAELGPKKELRDVLEKFFIRPGSRDAIENEIDIHADKLDIIDLENLKAAFAETKGRKEMDLFLEVRLMEHRLNEAEDFGTYSNIQDDLIKYAQTVLLWHKTHLEWMEPQAETEKVYREVLVAEDILRFTELEDTDITGAMNAIKDAIERRPLMDKVLLALLQQYSVYQKIQLAKRTQPDKFKEMYNLEEALLGQIAELDSTGHTKEAIATYRQLINLLQTAFGVDTLHL